MSIELVRDDTPEPPTAVGGEFEHFVRHLCGSRGYEPGSLRAWLDLAEAWKITRTLHDCRGNRSAAARALGIGRRTLYAKMDKLQIAPTWKVCDDRPGGPALQGDPNGTAGEFRLLYPQGSPDSTELPVSPHRPRSSR